MSDGTEAAAAAVHSTPSPPAQADAPTSPASTSAKASRPAPDSSESSSEANGEGKAPPKLPPRQRLRTNEGDKELGAPSDDAYSRKRDREGSMEPSSVSAPGMTHSASGPIPTKKNRLQSTQEAAPSGETEADSEAVDKDRDDEDQAADASAPSTISNAEGVKVGQIRKRVRDLQWEGQEGDKDEGEAHKKTLVDADAAGAAGRAEGKGSKVSAEAEESKGSSDAAPSKSPSRTQPSFSSFSSKPSAFSTAASSSSSSPFGAAAAAATSGGGRTQPTFSSFSSSASPFSKGGADVAGPSWLAGSGSSKPLGGAASSSGPGVKPSALGSSLGKTKASSPPPAAPFASSASSTKEVSSPKASGGAASKPASGGLGFGAFAGSNAFASAAKAAAKSGQSNGALDSESQDNDESKGSSDAGVRSPSAGASDAKAEDGKPKISALTEAELSTGEENERSVFSARAKLYVMDPKDQSWKERGTGTLRCNVPRSYVGGRRKGARLVMRAEGVLRLILNVPLFAGMKVDAPQDKFVRLVALEEGDKMVHLAIKLSNPAGASNLYNVISEHIPEEGRSTATEVTSWEA